MLLFSDSFSFDFKCSYFHTILEMSELYILKDISYCFICNPNAPTFGHVFFFILFHYCFRNEFSAFQRKLQSFWDFRPCFHFLRSCHKMNFRCIFRNCRKLKCHQMFTRIHMHPELVKDTLPSNTQRFVNFRRFSYIQRSATIWNTGISYTSLKSAANKKYISEKVPQAEISHFFYWNSNAFRKVHAFVNYFLPIFNSRFIYICII